MVLHPITNPDGAQLSVDLAKITPDNHAASRLSRRPWRADVSAGQSETDPIYPESRTRKQLIDAWLPDAFLNPHGYPSHEWVQPFSRIHRLGAEPAGRQLRARVVDSARLVHQPGLPARRHASLQQSRRVRDSGQIVEAERAVPGLLPLEDRMNARYERFGQRWQPRICSSRS